MAYVHPQMKNKRGGNGDISVLVSMCMFAFLILGAFVAFKMLPTFEFKIGNFFVSRAEQTNQATTLGPVQLGSTIDAVRKAHPAATKNATALGATTLSFADGNDQYIVWYASEGTKTVAFKARQSRKIVGVTEDEFVGDLAARYGAPSLASCSRRLADGMRDCHFSWWVPGKIRLDLNSRQFMNNAEPTLLITMQITDTRVEGRMRRTGQRVQSSRAY